MYRFLMFMALLCGSFGLAQAQGTITSDDASFVRGETAWDGTPEAALTGVSKMPADDHLYETGWAFRVLGDTREFFFSTPGLQTYAGALSEHHWSDVANRGLFSAIETSNVIDGDGPGGSAPSGMVQMRLTITNLSATDPLTLDLFHVIDLDVSASPGDDSGELLTPLSNPTIRFTDAQLPDVGYYFADDADAFAVRALDTLDINDVFDLLNDADIDNFDDSGLPASNGDYTAGMQWANRTIPPGNSLSVAVRFAINRPVLTPDLAITMQAAPDPARQDTPLDYTMTVTNSLDLPAPNTSIVFDAFPAAVEFAHTNGCDNDPVGYPECALGDMEAGAERQVTLRVVPRAGSPQVIEAVATVGSPDAADVAPQDNSVAVSTQFQASQADLTLDKTNDTGDLTTDIDGWNWVLTLRNAANATADAEFAPGDLVLLDQLPDVAVDYGKPSIAPSNGVSGTLSCEVVNFDLTCTAAVPLTLPPGTAVSVLLPVLPQTPATFDNPRAGGSCMADPGHQLAETSETNNACADSVLAVDFMVFGDGFED